MKTIKNQNRNGRPKKGSAEKKSYKISLKMDTEEYYSLKSKVRLSGISISEYIRRTIEKSEVQQRLSPEHLNLVRQIAGMANNLNQIARKTNAAGFVDIVGEYQDMIVQLDNIVKRITE
jgi:hypothetical protein